MYNHVAPWHSQWLVETEGWTVYVLSLDNNNRVGLGSYMTLAGLANLVVRLILFVVSMIDLVLCFIGLKQVERDEFNKVKALASDKSNLAFRTAVQTGEHEDTKDEAKTKSLTNTQILNSIGVKGVKPTRKRRSQAEITKDDYQPLYPGAVSKLSSNNNDAVRANLSVKECAAVITCGFGKYTGASGNKDTIRQNVNTFISKPRTDDCAFWKTVDDLESKKRKRDESADDEAE